MNLFLLPSHVIDDILLLLDPCSAVSFGQVCKVLHREINNRLYRKIMVVSLPVTSVENNNYTIMHYSKVPSLVRTLLLFPANCNLLQELLISTQIHETVNDPYLELYKLLQESTLLECVENLDIDNLRAFQSITQVQPAMKVLREGDYEMEDYSLVPMNYSAVKLKNRCIFDYDELLRLPVNSEVNELSIMIDTIPPVSVPSLKDFVPNLTALYLNLPAATLAFINGNSPKLNLETLSLTNTHTLQDFGSKTRLDTRLSYRLLSQKVNMSQLKELELKVNCDLHNNCENQCIYSFFQVWARESSANNLERLALINFKLNSSSGNLQQFAMLMSEIPSSIIQSLKELYINFDDYTRLKEMPSIPNDEEIYHLEFSNLLQILCNSNITKLTLPDFFNTWLGTITQPNNTENNLWQSLVNGCTCSSCDENRGIFQAYADFDEQNSYNHKFCSINNFQITPVSKVDATKRSNFKFLNHLVCSWKKRLNFSHKNLFTVNSALKMGQRPVDLSNETVEASFMLSLMKHLFLNDLLQDFAQQTKITELNLGGIFINLDQIDRLLKAVY